VERRSTGRQSARPLELSGLRLTVVAVGRLKAGPERELFARYVERVGALAAHVGISGVDWREVAEGRAGRLEDRRAEEARAILAAAPKGGWLAVLDERGASLTSAQWSAEIARARDGSVPAYAIVIGGPDGLDPTLRAAARSVISFGAMTWPHQLVRVMAAEQLYRALSIIAGHPYHRG
jgi:23S rRNA (pseudouridine1915-N3)-methyltransferase